MTKVQDVHFLSIGKLEKATIVVALLVILNTLAYVHAAVAFTPADPFATPPLDSTINFANNDAHCCKTFVNSLHKFKDVGLSTLDSSDAIGTSPTSISPNSTSASEHEKTLLSDEAYTVLLIVCFTAIIVTVSLMIAAVELNQWRHRKITL